MLTIGKPRLRPPPGCDDGWQAIVEATRRPDSNDCEHAPVDFVVRRGGRDDVDRLRPVWRALRDHHASLPEMPPARSLDDSWAHRRNQYLDWLSMDEHTLLLAERDGEPIGYAVVSLGGGAATWDVGERTVEIETLSVLESERGRGVGRALTNAAIGLAAEAGARSVLVGVAHSNADAIRFYEREGFTPFYVSLIRPAASSGSSSSR
jgi:ribosomal protein S18 acetylase RimI-like enzyme